MAQANRNLVLTAALAFCAAGPAAAQISDGVVKVGVLTDMTGAYSDLAGPGSVIGGRCKQSGMFWSELGAENILALRCIHSSRRLEDFWKDRLNVHAARNDALPLAA